MADLVGDATRSYTWTGYWGDYFNFTCTFDVHGVLTQDGDTLTLACDLTNFSKTVNYGSIDGGGYINVGGIFWGDKSEVPRQDIFHLWDTPYLYTDAYNEVRQAFGGADVFDAKNIYGFYACDKGDPPSIRGEWPGKYTHTFTFAADGFTGTRIVVAPYERYSAWNEEGHKHDNGYESTTRSYEGFTLTINDLFDVDPETSDYFPWAYRNTAPGWTSCDDDGHGVFVRRSGEWVPRKNSIEPNKPSTVYNRLRGAWVRAPKQKTLI